MPTYTFNRKNEYDATTDASSGQDLTIIWECLTDTASVEAWQAIAALAAQESIFKGAPHPSYSPALCVNVTAKKWTQDPFRFDVTAKFKEPRPQPGDPVNPEGGQPSPPDREPWIRGTIRREDRYQTRDLGDRTFKNSAGDLFSDPPAVPWALGQLSITRYYDSIDYYTLKSLENTTNNAAWKGFPAHSMLVESVEFEPHSVSGWNGWMVVYLLTHRAKSPEQAEITNLAEFTAGLVGGVVTGGWHPWPILDVGYKYLDGSTPRTYDEPAGSGIPKPVPGFLDAGARSSDATYLGFDIYARAGFTVIAPAT
jgi:hypothetical protein